MRNIHCHFVEECNANLKHIYTGNFGALCEAEGSFTLSLRLPSPKNNHL